MSAILKSHHNAITCKHEKTVVAILGLIVIDFEGIKHTMIVYYVKLLFKC